MELLKYFKIDVYTAKNVSNHLKRAIGHIFDRFPILEKHNDDLFFAGGCIVSLYLNESPRDLDLYVKNSKASDDILANLRIDDINFGTMGSMRTQSVYLNYVLNVKGTLLVEASKINLIFMHNLPPRETVKAFDMMHTINFFDLEERKLYLHPEAVYCIYNKVLYPRTPETKVKKSRIQKYMDRGWINGISPKNIIDDK